MLHSLQASRALAALVVVLHHTNHSIFEQAKYFGHAPLGCLVDFGFSAVDFFFVLSGFIIFYVHEQDIDQPRALPSYLWRRFSRIYLCYWVVLAAMTAGLFLVPQYGFAWQRDPDVLVRSVLLLPHPESLLVLSVAWTMVYEVIFYLVFAVLVLDKRLGSVVLCGWAIGVVSYSWFDTYPWNFVFSHQHLRILAGMAVAFVVRRWTIPWPRVVLGIGLALYTVLAVLENVNGHLPATMQIYGFTLSCAVIIAGLVEAERSGLIGVPGWLVYFGDATLAIYLVHFPALSVLAKLSKTFLLDQYLPSLVLLFLHVAGAIAAGCLVHHLVDKPLYTWSKRFCKRPKLAPALTVAEPENSEKEPVVTERRAA